MPNSQHPSMRPGLWATAAIFVAVTLAPLAGGNADEAKVKAYGRHLAQECTSCHRIDGIDNGIPSIVGWSPESFIATIGFYRSGSRTNPVMVSVAGSLDDRQIDALAAFFASLPKPAASKPAADNAKKK
jgi:cytochrome c553